MLKRLGFLLLLTLLIFTIVGCGSQPTQPKEPADPPAQEEPVGEEPAFSEAELLINARCSQCHGTEQIYRTRKKDAWPGIVQRMMSKASGMLDDQEYELVVEFLQDNYGN